MNKHHTQEGTEVITKSQNAGDLTTLNMPEDLRFLGEEENMGDGEFERRRGEN